MSFNIKISNEKGNVTNLKVTKNDTISQAKSAAGYTPPKSWKWKSNGCILKDENTIGFYEIEEDDVIIVSRTQPGGKSYK
jgi:hypothetical protein